VQQYIAATGGQPALNAVESMCVMGQIKITASDFHHTSETVEVRKTSEENGGFVLWQKDPDLWCLELVVSGCKVCCGSNGKVSWRHSSNQQSPVARGAPRPLRRFLQVCFVSRLKKCFLIDFFMPRIELGDFDGEI
jgi:hypothetical protein